MKFAFIAVLTLVINISAFETLGSIVFKTKIPFEVSQSADHLEKNKLAAEAATKNLDKCKKEAKHKNNKISPDRLKIVCATKYTFAKAAYRLEA